MPNLIPLCWYQTQVLPHNGQTTIGTEPEQAMGTDGRETRESPFAVFDLAEVHSRGYACAPPWDLLNGDVECSGSELGLPESAGLISMLDGGDRSGERLRELLIDYDHGIITTSPLHHPTPPPELPAVPSRQYPSASSFNTRWLPARPRHRSAASSDSVYVSTADELQSAFTAATTDQEIVLLKDITVTSVITIATTATNLLLKSEEGVTHSLKGLLRSPILNISHVEDLTIQDVEFIGGSAVRDHHL